VSAAAPGDASLAGEWRLRLDPGDAGVDGRWYRAPFPDVIRLPGTTDLAEKGESTHLPACGHLSRATQYIGPAWYQREVNIPGEWSGKHASLFLERCLWQTQLWVDDRLVGTQDSLCTPHLHEIGRLEPGRHRLTLRVDNRAIVNLGDYQHAYTEQTQIRWNGVVGDLSLQATDPVWVERVQLYPDVAGRTVEVSAMVRNETGAPVGGTATVTVYRLDGRSRRRVARLTHPLPALAEEESLRLRVPLGARAALWDQHHPVLHEAEVRVDVPRGGYSHLRAERFGLREIATRDHRILVNGSAVFLRGTVECCVFPLTGNPPTELEAWRRVVAAAREHGLNHFRFHSWCPPEAAFQAADEAGFLLHVESPLWDQQNKLLVCDFPTEEEPWQKPARFGRDPEVVRFIEAEVTRILEAYGNHPSFAMFCVGNELAADYGVLEGIVGRARARDPRHLYSCSTARTLTPSDEFYVTHQTPKGRVRGLLGEGTDWDFLAARDGLEIPVISHEIGQWVTHPDYSELTKYTGALKPRNLERLRDMMAGNGILEQAHDFQMASGRFAWALYRTEIEAALRTPLAGFQLLQLNDYPGQGEAMVGLLDAFWDSKGILSPREFRRFCADTVALLRFPRWVWNEGETLSATAEVYHAGSAPLRGLRADWWLRDEAGRTLAEGRLPSADAAAGQTTRLGGFSLTLPTDGEARRLRLGLRLGAGNVENDWGLWVFPRQVAIAAPEGVTITDRLDEAAASTLRGGGQVLLLIPPEANGEALVPTRFLPVFWSGFMFPAQAGCNGFLVDASHPALDRFPTATHSDWQWRDVADGGKAVVLNGAPPELRPIVQPIDDFHRANRLGAVFEARVGDGRLLVCGLDLARDLETRPAARQLRHSLLSYMASDHFRPAVELDLALLRRWLG
jgi:hypothetical protein